VINTRVDVRPATVDDLAAVNDIYNQYVAETHYTFDIKPMKWTSDRLRVQQPVPP
jgi:L-amino acid N-acyltransferase YncA